MIASLDISVEVKGAEQVTMNRMVKWLNRQEAWEYAVQQLIGRLVVHTRPPWPEKDGAHFNRGGSYDLPDGRGVLEYTLAFTHTFRNKRLARIAVETIAEEVQIMASVDALKQLRSRAIVASKLAWIGGST